MSLIQLIIPSEVAHATVTELGELGNVQFKDVSVTRPRPHYLTYFPLLAQPGCDSIPTFFCL